MTQSNNSVLESCLGNAQSLSGLIDYAADSIVSKTILDKPVGTITLFAFDKNQRLSQHTAPYHAVVQVVDGKGIFTVDGKDIEATVGQLLIMPAGIPHAVHAAEKFKMLLTMIRE
jgi:quercetin dioxygenase-like cupin family protein